MKKILTLGLLLIMMFSLTACKSDGDDVSSIEAIKAKGELVLLTESGFPPFEYADEGAGSVDGVNGVDIEFGKLLAEKLGVTLKVVDMNFDSLTLALSENKGDLIAAGMTNNPERAEVVDFSSSYYDNGLFVLVAKDSKIQSLDDLKGKKVSVQQGTTGDIAAQKVEGAEVLQFKSMIEAGEAVNSYKSDASIMDILTAQILVATKDNLKILDFPVESEKTALAVAKGNSGLLELVNEVIQEVKDSGQLQKWFDVHYEALINEQN